MSSYAAYLREYLSNDETAKEVLTELRGLLGEEASRLVEGAMRDYLTNQFVPYFSGALGSLMSEEIELSRVGADTLVTPREVIRDFIEMLDIMLQDPGVTVEGQHGQVLHYTFLNYL